MVRLLQVGRRFEARLVLAHLCTFEHIFILLLILALLLLNDK